MASEVAFPDFVLDRRLAADTVELTRWPLSLVLLINERRWPWLILVPRRPELRDLDDLPPAGRTVLIEETARASRVLKDTVRPAKINVAALGNMVPQLHIHVVARFADDPAWPRPVWGTPPELYEAEALRERAAFFRQALNDS
jgi:diadenosine tetraphosphate (Ap4A) HIT family hydrolase